MKAVRKKRYLWILLALLAVAAVAAIRFWPKPADTGNIVEVERFDLAKTGIVKGKIQPVNVIEITSNATGAIESIPVRIGDVVRKGEVVCKLNRDDLLSTLHEQEIARDAAEEALKTARDDFEMYTVESEGGDISFVRSDRDRARDLFAGNAISRAELEAAEKTYKAAALKQDTAKLKLASAEADMRSARAAFLKQQASFAAAVQNLNNAVVVAPVYGVIVSVNSKIGQIVSSGRADGFGATPLMTIGDLNEVYVKGQADLASSTKLHLYQSARITVDAFRQERFTGEVRKIVPHDTGKVAGGSDVFVQIANRGHVLDGAAIATAEILLEEHKRALAVPEGAIVHNKDKSTAVRVVDPNAPKGYRSVAIVTGIRDGARTEVLRGLAEGQKVIVR